MERPGQAVSVAGVAGHHGDIRHTQHQLDRQKHTQNQMIALTLTRFITVRIIMKVSLLNVQIVSYIKVYFPNLQTNRLFR